MTATIERVVTIGPDSALVGIVTEPRQGARTDLAAVIILNTGIIHRVGHHRMFVTLARELGKTGHSVLRFDLSGLGDSQAREEAVDPLIASLADIRSAVDWMVSRGATRLVLMGLCAGADHGVVYGSYDPRIGGLVLLDPSIPPTRRFVRIALRRRIARLIRSAGKRGLPRVLYRKARARLLRKDPPPAWKPLSIQIHQREVRDFIEGAYARVVERGVQIYAIFTSGLEHQHNYREQIIEAFRAIRFGKQLRLDYLEAVDHTFSREADRGALFARVAGWIAEIELMPASAIPSDPPVSADRATT